MQPQTASQVVDALSLVAANIRYLAHKTSSEGSAVTKSAQIKLTSSNNISGKQVDRETAVEVDTSSTLLGRVLNTEQFEKVIGFVVVVVSHMSGSYEKQRNICLGLLVAILAVYVMEHWVMTRKVIIFGIALNFPKLLCFYLLLCILKPEWLNRYGFVIVCSIAIAYTFSDELKTKFTWCCEKGNLVINYVIDKVSKPLNDHASPSTTPPPPPPRVSP